MNVINSDEKLQWILVRRPKEDLPVCGEKKITILKLNTNRIVISALQLKFIPADTLCFSNVPKKVTYSS